MLKAGNGHPRFAVFVGIEVGEFTGVRSRSDGILAADTLSLLPVNPFDRTIYLCFGTREKLSKETIKIAFVVEDCVVRQ